MKSMKCNPAQEIMTLCSSIVQTGHSGSQGKGSESAKVEAEGERERESRADAVRAVEIRQVRGTWKEVENGGARGSHIHVLGG
jgi:hypothetical protein